MEREDSISSATMIKSRYRLPSYDKEPKGKKSQGEASTAAGGDTDEEIDQFTVSLDDILPSPPQPQTQAQLRLMLQIALIRFLLDWTTCKGPLMSMLTTPKVNLSTSKSRLPISSIASKIWIQMSSNFGHSGQKREVVLA